jgi:hypothetical protein
MRGAASQSRTCSRSPLPRSPSAPISRLTRVTL